MNTGPVVIAPGDGDARGRYNALGDTVNVTARLQAIAAEGEVLLGPQTAVQVRSSFELEELGPTSLRGRAEPIDRYRVVREVEQGPTAPEGALVGRDAELAEVRDTLDRLADGIGAILAITGEAGIGKSRLVTEAAAPLGDRLLVLEGRGLSYAQDFPYGPVRELLRDWLGAGATTSEARVRLDLKAAVQPLFPDPDDVYPFLAGLLGLMPDAQTAARLREFSPETVHMRSVHAVSDLVCALARERPAAARLRGPALGRRADARPDRGAARADRERPGRPRAPLPGRPRRGLVADRRAGPPALPAPLPRARAARRSRPTRPARLCASWPTATSPSRSPRSSASARAGTRCSPPRPCATSSSAGSMRHGDSGWELAVDPDALEVPPLVQGVSRRASTGSSPAPAR